MNAGAYSPARDQYTPVAKALHWVIVLLLIVQYTLGWTMPEIGRGTVPETLIDLHLSVGALILLTVLVRIGWRVAYAPPPLIGLPAWQMALSHATHALLYLVLIAIPVLGWMSASARGWDVTLFGLVSLPHIDFGLSGGQTGDLHVLLSYVLLALVGVHVLAALYHGFVLRDAVLDRILPQSLQIHRIQPGQGQPRRVR